jgi:hypothetical protein
VRELQGGGTGSTAFLSDTLYSWDGAFYRGQAPHEFNFETLIPTFTQPEGERRLLPPSYDSRLSAIPGFRVSVQYEFVVSITRTAGAMDFWKKRTRCVVCTFSILMGYAN